MGKVTANTFESARRHFIAELRSGKYRQTRRTFISAIDKDYLCAMGVAGVACGMERYKDTLDEWTFKGPSVTLSKES